MVTVEHGKGLCLERGQFQNHIFSCFDRCVEDNALRGRGETGDDSVTRSLV